MSNTTAQGMSATQVRTAGRFAGNAGERGALGHPIPGPLTREVDPALAGLLSWLPPAGGTMSRSAIDRWAEAARAILMFAYAGEDE